MFVALIQLALALHVRNILIDSAAEGARFGAIDGNEASDAAERTHALITASLNDRFASDIGAVRASVEGVEMIEVTVSAPLPLVWLYGPSNTLTVTGRAVDEANL